MSAFQLFNLPKAVNLDASANILAGAKATFYATGTTNLQDTYTTSALSVAHTNPVVADSNGVFPAIYLNPALVYKVTLTTAADVLIYTQDPTNDQLLSQAVIGELLYPRTAAEISAGVTPTSYAYPEGHVLRYGTGEAGLIAAAAYCATSGVPIIGTTATVTLTATLVLNCKGDLSMMTVEGDSSAVSPLLRVGTTSGNPIQLDGILRLPRVSNTDKPGSGWASQQTGVEFANLYEADIYVPYIYGFDVGLDCGGYNSGCAYNTIRLGQIVSNKRGVRLNPKTTNGWCNQNQFKGGRIWIPTAEGSAISGARFLLLEPDDVTVSTGSSWPNANTFDGTSMEGDGPEYQAEIAGNNNLFVNCRWEATAPAVKLTGHASATKTYENMFHGGYQVSSITFTSSGVIRYTGILHSRIASLGGSGVVLNMSDQGSSANPLIQGFDAGVAFLNKTNSATDWSVRLAANGLQGKATGDGSAQVDINFPNGTGQFRRVLMTSAAFSTSAGVVMLGNSTQTTVGAAGGASALPATPTGYLRFFIGSTEFVLPYYARA